MAKKSTYNAKDIEVLEGLEPVRKRPGMYIGSTNQDGLHHLVNEVLDNSIDEVLAGHATDISFQYKKDGSIKIKDNGRGIPIDFHPKYKNKRALEVVLTTLHAGGKFNSNAYKTSGGLHGVGISVVNALSSLLQVHVFKDGKEIVKNGKVKNFFKTKTQALNLSYDKNITKYINKWISKQYSLDSDDISVDTNYFRSDNFNFH